MNFRLLATVSTVTTLATLTVLPRPLQAQAGRLLGTVRSTDGSAVIGARVLVVGTSRAGISMDDGHFALTLPPGTYALRVERYGFRVDSVQGLVVSAGATLSHDVTLTPLATPQPSAMTTGYGIRNARDRTGASTSLNESELDRNRGGSVGDLIAATVPGAQVVSSGEPGALTTIRIRGLSSVNVSTEPLFVVDGIPLSVGGGVSSGRDPLNFLAPGDIESITVLKDAAASAIYGSRASNGVVLIATKGGGDGFTFSSSYGSSAAKQTGVLDATQLRAAVTTYASANLGLLGNANTNWQDLVTRNASGRANSLAYGGSTGDRRYRVSFDARTQDGVMAASGSSRTSAALSFRDVLFGDRLEVKLNLRASKLDDAYTPGGTLANALAFAPNQAPTTAGGAYFQWSYPFAPNNPLADLPLLYDHGTTNRTFAMLEARYRLPMLDGLTATVRAGYDDASAERTTFSPNTARSEIFNGRGGYFTRGKPQQSNSSVELFGSYAHSFGASRRDLDVTVGFAKEQSNTDFSLTEVLGIGSVTFMPGSVPTGQFQRTGFAHEESGLTSSFARVNFGIADKYLFTAVLRGDGSSRFGPSSSWGWFPAAAMTWRVKEEPFMRGVSSLSDLTMRLSWGVAGNQPNVSFIGGALAPALNPANVDPSIRSERTTTTNLGADVGLFGNRLTGSVDLYDRKTSDLIFIIPVAGGLSNTLTSNIGSLENVGAELGIAYAFLQGGLNGLTWDMHFTAAKNSNRILSINYAAPGQRIQYGDISGSIGASIQVLTPGSPVGSFFVYQQRYNANGTPRYNAAGDTAMYVDQNGDGVIDQNDRRAYHSSQPDWILGHTSSLRWGAWDAAFTLRANVGNYTYNNVASRHGFYAALSGPAPVNLSTSVLKSDFVNPQYFSDFYVEDASFLRMDNITVGYTFTRVIGLKSLRLYGSVVNAFTISGYSGVDPVALNPRNTVGIDDTVYPLARTFLVGLKAHF